MDELILRSLEGELSDLEQRRLADWRGASSDHDHRYRELTAVARLLARARPMPADPTPPAPEVILPAARRGRGLPRRRGTRFLVAAAVTLLIGGGGYLLGARTPAPAFMACEFVTGPGETSTIHLADGSTVRLAESSRIRVDQTGRREVWLEGTAFFVVAKQAGARFVVRTKAGSATVLGTRFEMKTTDDRIRVVVVEGTVVVANDHGDQVKLDAGHMTFTGPEQPPSVSRVPDPHRLVDWGGKVLLFQDTPLRQAVREIESKYGMTIVIGDSAFGEHLLSATLPAQPVEQLLSTICQILAAQCSIATDTAWIGRSERRTAETK